MPRTAAILVAGTSVTVPVTQINNNNTCRDNNTLTAPLDVTTPVPPTGVISQVVGTLWIYRVDGAFRPFIPPPNNNNIDNNNNNNINVNRTPKKKLKPLEE